MRIDRLDVVGRHGELVEHRYQLPALELGLDLPGRAPADAQALFDPVVEEFAVIAIEIAGNLDRHLFAIAQEGPAALLATLQVERQAVVLGQILEGPGCGMALKIVRRTADHPPIGEQLDRHVVGVGHLADANAHVVALTHQVDHAVGQVERQVEVRVARLECRRMRRDMPTAERRRRRHHQVPAHRMAAVGDAGVGLGEIAQQTAGPLQVLLAQIGQRQAAGRAMHQLDPQVALEHVEAPAHHHRGHPFDQGGGGEAAVIGHQNETVQSRITVHSILLIPTEMRNPAIYPINSLPSCFRHVEKISTKAWRICSWRV